ncbi:MAG: hypothetical protein J3K34DRAFT_427667 [Monoraphidium minutum]|nr:MAG: hypothetical protein J3K34DRAFT_427667 [Monoraphidium minutum]
MSTMLRGLSGRSTAFKAAGSRRAAPPAAPQQLQRQRAATGVCRGVEASVAAAVTQQAIAYAVVLGAEGAFSYTQTPAGDRGRPQIPLVGAGVAGTAAAIALVKLSGDSPASVAGLAVGLLTSGAMMAVAVKRALDLEYDDGDWPGPKAWPAGMALISFFALSAFWQALFPLVFGK